MSVFFFTFCSRIKALIPQVQIQKQYLPLLNKVHNLSENEQIRKQLHLKLFKAPQRRLHSH